MIPVPRLRHALLLLGSLAGPLAIAALGPGCGPEPQAVEACRKIESARCNAAASCGLSEVEVEDCELVYADQCLHGIENSAHRPTEAEIAGCLAAVNAAGACAAAGEDFMSACPDAPLVAGALDRSPCEVILSFAHELDACAFVEAEADAGTTTTTSAAD